MPGLGYPTENEGDFFFLDYYSGLMRRLGLSGGTWVPESAPGQPTAMAHLGVGYPW